MVVGARAAGAATARLLARSGLSVLLVDRWRYGTDTLSTHALMRGGVLQLRRWGLLEQVIAAGTPPVRQATFRYDGQVVAVAIKPSYGVDALYAPRRTVLDPILVDAAEAAGAEVRFGVAVTEVERDRPDRHRRRRPRPRRPRVPCRRAHRRRGGRGPLDRRRAGRALLRARRHRRRRDDVRLLAGPRRRRLRVELPVRRCVRRDPDQRRPDLRVRERHTASDRPRRGGHAAEILAETDAELAAGSPPRPRRDAHVHRVRGYLRRSWGPGWALVGDAGYFKDPLSAHGLTDALRDAELLARAIVDGRRDGADEREALAGYQATRDALSRDVRRDGRDRRAPLDRRRDRRPADAAQRRDVRRGRHPRRPAACTSEVAAPAPSVAHVPVIRRSTPPTRTPDHQQTTTENQT